MLSRLPARAKRKCIIFVNFQRRREAKMAIFKLSSILKNSSALGSFTCIFENNSLKALFGKIWRNWKFWNCCRIFDIYRNWLLNTLKENGGLILKQKQNAQRSIPASVMTVMAVSPRFSYFWKTSIFPYIFCNFDTLELQKMYGNIMNIMECHGIPFRRK